MIKRGNLLKTILSLLVLCTTFPLLAQIKGTVTDTQLNPIAFVNVALYALPDTTFITGAVTDSLGNYTITTDREKNSVMRVTMVGYTTVQSVIADEERPILRNFTLEPDERMLQELVVEGERPVMKAEAGRLIYHISPLVRNKPVTNAYDALKEIPGVIEQDEQLTLIGTSGMTVLINGQKTSMTYEQLMTLLRSIPVSRLEDVEIMYSAPPQYNIRGAAINVILKQESGESLQTPWQGELSGGYTQRAYGSENGRANLYHIGRQTTVDLLYGYNHHTILSSERLIADHMLQEQRYQIDQQSEGVNHINRHNLRLAADHKLKNSDVASISYAGQFGRSHSDQTATTDISGTVIGSDIDSEGPNTMHNFKADYSSHIGLKAGADYTWYHNRSDYSLLNTHLESSTLPESIQSSSSQTIHRTFLYANQTHTLKESWQLNYGLNYSLAQTLNKADAEKDSETYDEATFDTRQDEDIWNLFAGFSGSLSPKLSLQASLAAEFYRSTEQMGDTRRTLWNDMAWFPTLNISYNHSASHILQLELSSDKTYPPYWSLNPSVYHFGAYGVAYGNPLLRPLKVYSAGLTYIYKQKYVIRPYFNQITDYYTQLPYQSQEQLRQEFVMQNFNYQQTAGLMMVLPFHLGKKISSRLVLNGMYRREKDDSFYDIPFDRNTVVGFIQLNSDIRLSDKPNLRMNISGYYATPGVIQGIYDLGWLGDLSAGVTWSFAQERAKIIFKGTDFFKTNTPNASIYYMGQKSSLDATRDTRSFSLSFVYRFGGYKEKERKEVDTSRFGM
jgi:hypothetical protein